MAKKQAIHAWIKSWEDRAGNLQLISETHAFNEELRRTHAFNEELRRQVIYASLPKDVKEMVDAEKSKGEPVTHKALRDWLVSPGTNAALSAATSPAQLVINNLALFTDDK